MREIWHSRLRRFSLATGWGLAVKFDTGDWKAGTLYVHLIYLGLFVRVPLPWRNPTKREREWGFTVHDWTLWLTCGAPSMEWSRSEPWWMRARINLPQLLFGRQKCETVEGEKRAAVVPMPEGSYHAVLQQETRTWTRSRLPFWKRKRVDWNISIDGGIPFQGKGENSWDCGDDGLWGTGGDSPEGAVANAVKSVLRARAKYGECESTRGRVVWARPTPAGTSPGKGADGA